MRQSKYHECRSVAHFVSRTLPDTKTFNNFAKLEQRRVSHSVSVVDINDFICSNADTSTSTSSSTSSGFIVGIIIGSVVILVILIVMSIMIIYLCRRKTQTRVVVREVPPIPMEAYDNEEEADDDNEEDAGADDQQPSVPSDPYQDYTDYQDEDDDYENGPRGLGGDYYTYYDEDGRFVRTNTIHYR